MKAPSALLLLLLVGCGQGASEAPSEAAEAPRESVFDPLTGTLDRAQGVEDTLSESAAARRRQLEEAEGRFSTRAAP